MTILYKICLYEERLQKNGGKPITNSMFELVFTCLNSILKQMLSDDDIILFCDGNCHTDKIIKLCNYYKITPKILTFNYKNASKIHYESVMYINSNKIQDLIYICEDDYLHFDNSLDKIKEFLIKYPGYFCHPIDYPNLYEKDSRFLYDSKIILTNTHHWRSIKSTTYTFAFTKSLYEEHIRTFTIIKDYVYDEHGINLLYVFNKCFSPIPSLTSHISNECIPYVVDSNSTFNKNLSQLYKIL